MYILSINMWFQKLMKQFFFGIDQVVFNMISSIYDLLISIARTSILTQSDILDMADRVYKLLAVFMIFKVTLSLITYVVNPDDFVDKSKGISKLVMNIIISLGLLILTPYIFNMAYKLQTIILEDNTLATLIFDTSTEEKEATAGDFINTAGDKMAFIAMTPFFSPNTSLTKLGECIDLLTEDGKFNPKCSGLNTSYDYASDRTNTMAYYAEASGSSLKKEDLQNFVVGYENENLGLMFRQDLVVATDEKNDNFLMEYKYLFSTVMGVVIILLLLSFCMDVALRSIKLAFLQLIAPIPILSYVDPKSGKDGMFKKWYQLCFKTYLSLFIRLLALYFAIYIIGRVDSMVDIVDGTYQTNTLIKIFVIIGALMFAKQFPKILEGLGIKLDGDGKFFLNPLKKLDEEAFGFKKGRQVSGRLGMAGLAGAAAFGTNMLATDGNFFKKLGSGIAGATSATGRGLWATAQGKKATDVFTNSYSAANQARRNRDDRQELGVSALDVWDTSMRQRMGMTTAAQEQDVKVKRYDEVISAAKTAKTRAESEVDKKADKIVTANGQTLGALRDKVEILKSTSIDRNDYVTRDEHGNEIGFDRVRYEAAVDELASKTSEANAAYFAARKAATNVYVRNAANGTLSTTDEFGGEAGSVFNTEDAIVRENVSKATSAAGKYSLEDENGDQITINVDDIGVSIQTTEDAKTKIEASDEFRKAHLVEEQVRKEKK